MRADLSKLTFPTVLFYLEPDFLRTQNFELDATRMSGPERSDRDRRQKGRVSRWDRDDEILPIQAEFIEYDHRMLGTRLTTGRRAHRGYRYSKFLRSHLCFVGDARREGDAVVTTNRGLHGK